MNKKRILFAFTAIFSLILLLTIGCRTAPRNNNNANQQKNTPKYTPAGKGGGGGNNNYTPANTNNNTGNPPAPNEDLPTGGGNQGGKKTALVPPPLPRTLVYMQGEETDLVTSQVEEVFVNDGFKLIDRTQLQNIKEVDAALSTNDKDKLKALKNRYGIEVIVAGKVRWNFLNTRRVYGRQYNYYKGRISMKAIVADTASIIYSKTSSTQQSSSTSALQNKAKSLARIFAEKLKQHWAKKRYQGREFDVVVSKAPYKKLNALESYIKNINQITSAARRSYAKKTAFYSVGFRGQMDDLEKALLSCSNPKLKVVRTTSNRIELEVTDEGYTPPSDTNPPQINITSPQANTTVNKKKMTVKGTVSDDKGVASVTVNGTKASVSGGNFQAQIGLSEGKVVIEAIATDTSGNTSRDQVEITVDYTPPKVSMEVTIDGTVDKPGSKVWVNGKRVKVVNGRWEAKIDISKTREVVIIAEDPQGNKSRTVKHIGGGGGK